MRIRPELTATRSGSLLSAEGELVIVRIAVDPRRLEQLLETLSQVPFPINPEIFHNIPVAGPLSGSQGTAYETTVVEFPAYSGRLPEVRDLLSAQGFDPASVRSQNVLEHIRSGASARPMTADTGYEAAQFQKPASAGN